MIQADTVSALQALAVPTSDYACVLRGRDDTEDGLGGLFTWYPNLIQGENGGTVIKPSAVGAGAAGRWVRQYSGAANLLWFGADKTGVADSSAAFYAAFVATHTGQEILVPYGTYLLQPDHPTFKFWSRRWTGETAHADSATQTIIKPTGPGSKLAWLASLGHIRGIQFDADNQCEYALYCGAAHGSTLQDCFFRGATESGLMVHQSTMSGRNLNADSCRRGITLRGANGSAFWFIAATNCTGTGLLIEGNYSGNTTQSGSVKVDGGVVDLCSTVHTDEALVELDGVEQAWVTGLYIEGDGTGVRLKNKAHNCTLRDLRFVLGGGYAALDLAEARGCLFEACCSPLGSDEIAVATHPNGTGSYDNRFVACRALSATNTRGMNVTVTNTADDSTWSSRLSPNDEWQSASAPTVGWWRVGDRVGNHQCEADGYPGTWLSDVSAKLASGVSRAKRISRSPSDSDLVVRFADLWDALDSVGI